MLPPIQSTTSISFAAGVTLTKLEEAIQQASSQYFRLVILAGPPGSGKTAALQSVAQKIGCQIVNVNLELSKKMLELTRSQRSRQVGRLLKEVIAAAPGEVALLDNLEILFDTSLEVEPLRLLQVSSRNRTVVASWSGSYVDGTLTYAEPGHSEFVQFKQVDAIVVTVGKSATD
jgi:DNA polymerase III delta prime subunit